MKLPIIFNTFDEIYLVFTVKKLTSTISYDVAVIQWITSYRRNRITDHTCNNTFARTGCVIDNDRVNNAFSHRNNVHFGGEKPHF